MELCDHHFRLRPALPTRACLRSRALARGVSAALVMIAGGFTESPAAELELFDEGLFAEGEVEIVNGKVMVRPTPPKQEEVAQPDPAGDQVLELTDGSQLHGRLVALAKSEVVWQRADATEPLSFTPQEVRRIVLAPAKSDKPAASNATVKLAGSDWLAGQLTGFADGKFSLQIGTDRPLEIPREKVEWLYLSPQISPDTYDGPLGPMGLAGWETALEPGAGWDYADGALVAKNASPILRHFDALPEKVDLQFTAGDGGTNNRGLTLWIQPGNRTRGYVKGSCFLRFQSNTVNGNYSTGGEMKNFNANIPEEKDDRKLTRYRLLFDRVGGRLVIFVNGRQIADWDLPETTEPSATGNLSWQPSYWSSNMAWTLSNIRVQPWDGALPPDPGEEAKGKDALSVSGEPRRVGALERVTEETVAFDGAELPRKGPMMIRMAALETVEPPPSAIARVWLTQRGEFDVTGIGFRDGVLRARASFGGDLSLPASAVRAIEFPHKAPPAAKNADDGGDTLVFKNGDQLRGTLMAASHAEPLQWKPVKGDRVVEFSTGSIAGILLQTRPAPEEKRPAQEGAPVVAARLRNGDWLPGTLLGLDEGSLHLKSEVSGDLRIRRDALNAIYLSADGEAPVWDGASERDAWIRGTSVPGHWGESGSRNRRDEKRGGPWRYLDGAFTLVSGNSARGYNSGPNLGRTLQALSEKVEVSFVLSTTKGPASYSIQLFFDENKPGFMVQGGWDSAYLYDMAPRRNGGAFFNQPQQLEFGEKVGSEGNQRHFRFLGDRKTGRLWMFVNGHLVGSLSKRAGGDSPKGKGISIIPQPMLSRVTVSNLWVGPWSGTLPVGVISKSKDSKDAAQNEGASGLPKPEPSKKAEPLTPAPDAEPAGKPEAKAPPEAPAPPRDTIALGNGDETSGKIVRATREAVTMNCDVGELEIPLSRATLIEFAANPQASAPGIRLRFAGKGALTVDTLRIQNGQVICRSAAAGELAFPLSSLTEIIYRPSIVSDSSGSATAQNSEPPRPAAAQQ